MVRRCMLADGLVVRLDRQEWRVTAGLVGLQEVRLDELIINEFHQVMDIGEIDIVQHWLGVYPSGDDVVFTATPEKGVVVGSVTGGTGASTGFAFGEELIDLVLESK